MGIFRKRKEPKNNGVEWQVMLEDDDWGQPEGLGDLLPDRATDGTESTGSGRGKLLWALFALLVLFLCPVSLYSGQWASQPTNKSEPETSQLSGTPRSGTPPLQELNEDKSHADLLQAVESVIRQGHIECSDRVLLDKPGYTSACVGIGVVVQPLLIELHGSQALVTVNVENTYVPTTYRQTLTMQRMEQGWLLAVPDTNLWGGSKRFDSQYFVFHYYARDEAAVAAATAELDAIYAQLESVPGLRFHWPAGKPVIFVEPAVEPMLRLTGGIEDGVLTVASPIRFPMPIHISQRDVLVQAVAGPLISHAVALASRNAGSTWDSLLQDGLYLWLSWELDLPLSRWQREVIDWLQNDTNGRQATGPNSLPGGYRDMCRLHGAWRTNPTQLGIPVGCSPGDGTAGGTPIRAWTLDQIPLASLRYGMLRQEAPSTAIAAPFGATVSMATLFDYAVATYGHDALPRLLHGIDQYESWQALIPAVFGVTAEQFEQGWQAHVESFW